ncbi:MOSC domain-containing protein [Actinocrinis puniceicyclus]|uniref:MOSC domain-containing protein n=1 Tax=Actinocrinis puniceicyclus TaxID=977794 RepID=A0A8J7WQQ3_9ACTN|nr:MOSC domain-containing protein [Actinocrinis puniceicyclus]
MLSVNLAASPRHTDVKQQSTGIGKLPVAHPVQVSAPGPKGVGGSGLAGDAVCDLRNHGGDDQAVYAYAREDLDWWERELGRELPAGMFGENLTTAGLDLTGALVGERWRVGGRTLLQVTSPRIPCEVFAQKMDEAHWVKRFTEHGATGAYLRVVEPGPVRAGDPVTIEHRPGHQVTLGLFFRAATREPHLLGELLAAGDALPQETRDYIARRTRV